MLTVEGNWDKNFVRLRNKLQAGEFFLETTVNLPGSGSCTLALTFK